MSGIGLSFVKHFLNETFETAGHGEECVRNRIISTSRKSLKECPDLMKLYKKVSSKYPKQALHLELDVSSVDSIKQIPSKLHNLGIDHIDILINNAGVLQRDESILSTDQSIDQLSKSIQDQFITNSMGPVLVTKALLPFLKAGSKVIVVTSQMGSIDDNGSGKYYGYRMSKTAVNMAVKSMSVDLKSKKIPVCCVHPGYVQTDMTGGGGSISPDTSAERMIKNVVEKLNMQTSGSFFDKDGGFLPW